MEALSWFKFCPAKWNMGKVKKLSMEERADYLDLCSSYWVGGCVMSADEMREHSDCIDVFIRRGLVSDDGIEWLNAQYEEATRKSEAASKAAKTRWEKKQQCESNANAMHPHSERNASVMQRREEESRVEEKEKKERERDKRADAPPPSGDVLVSGNLDNPNTHTPEPQKKEKVAPKRKVFSPPTIEDLREFFGEVNMIYEADKFFDYYTANGWMVGKVKMKDWKATARNWARRKQEYSQSKPQSNGKPFADLTPGRFVDSVRAHVEKKQRDRANGYS